MQRELSENQSKFESIQEEKSEVIFKFENIFEALESRSVRRLDAKAYAEWIKERIWIVFLTLTFKNETTYDVAIKKYYWLVKELNKEVFGNNYTRIVKHSYFSYVLGIEYQRRGVIHFHVLIDKPVNFKLIRSNWEKWAGYAHPEEILLQENVVKYITKYVSKGGEMITHLADHDKKPLIQPYWWKNDSPYIRNKN